MIVPTPLRLIALGLLNESYQGPAISNPGVNVSSSSPLGANPQYLEDGAHLRWAFQRRLQWPKYGFRLYRRSAYGFPNALRLTYNSSLTIWEISSSAGSGQNATLLTSTATSVTIGIEPSGAAVLRYASTTLAPPGSLAATGLTSIPGQLVPVSPQTGNLGDITPTTAGVSGVGEDVVVVVPDHVDLGQVYGPLGKALAQAQGKTDPYYGAYLAGLYDSDSDNDENFGAGDGDSDDSQTEIQHDLATIAGTLSAAGTPWLDGLEISLDPSHMTAVEISLVPGINTRLKAAVATGTQTATPVSMSNIFEQTYLRIGAGTTNEEVVQVSSVNGTSFTATFALSHNAGEPIGDLPPYRAWKADGWQLIAKLGFPSSRSEATARVLSSVHPSSWDTEDPPNSGHTTATDLVTTYGKVYDQVANMLGDGTTIDPNQTADLSEMNPLPGQEPGSFQLGAMDTLLALGVDHYIARMWGLAYCDSTAVGAQPPANARPRSVSHGRPSFDYLIAGFWTEDPNSHGVPDYYGVTYSVYVDDRAPLPAPQGISGSPILQGFQPVDNSSNFSATTAAVPAIGLNWDLKVDLTGADQGLEVGAPVAFDVYRTRDNAGSPQGAFGKVNKHPVIIPLSQDPSTGNNQLPAYYYVDVGPVAASPGGYGLLSGSYDYRIVATDIFGRISPSSALGGPFKAPTLPPPPAPASVSATYLADNNQFLSSAQQAKLAAAGGSTADVTWHWTGSLLQGFRAHHFNLYHRKALPAPQEASLSFSVIGGLNDVLPPGQFKVSVSPQPTNVPALVGGTLIQGGYRRVIEHLGGPVIPSGSPPTRLAAKQWLIVDAHATGSAATLTLQRPPDADGSQPETEGDVPAEGTCQLAFNLSDRALWAKVPSATLSAGTLPPPPASSLLLACGAGDTTLVVENPGELKPGTLLTVGSDSVQITSAIGQTLTLKSGIANTWPGGTPVSPIFLSSAIKPGILGVRSLTVNDATGITPGQSIQVGLRQGGAGTATTLTAAVTAGVQTVTPVSMSNILPGTQLLVDNLLAAETVIVTMTTATTFTASFAKGHSTGAAIEIVDDTARLLVTGVSGNALTFTPQLRVPWPKNTPVSVVDIPYDLAPLHSTFATLGMEPAGKELLSGGYFAVSTVAISPQTGQMVEGPVSAPAQITTVSYTAHKAPPPPKTRPACSELNRILTDAADVNGISRATVPLPDPPAGPLAYVEVWRASDESIFAATGAALSLADTCETNWALTDLANNSIDRSGLPTPPATTLSAAAASAAATVHLTDATGAQKYRNLVFLNESGHHVETVTIRGTYNGGTSIPIFPPLSNSYPSGQPVQIISQGMGPFTLVKKDPIPWLAGSSFVDDTLHGLSDNVYFYTFVSVPVQTDAPLSDPTHQVQGAGARSLAWPVTAPYQIMPTRPPLAPASIAAKPGSTAGNFNQIALAWNYDLPSGQQLLDPPSRTYTIYRSTSSDEADDVRLMTALAQVEFSPAKTAIAAAISSGLRTVTPSSMATVSPGGTLVVFDSPDGVAIRNVDIITVLSTTATTFSAHFGHSHAAGSRVVGGMAEFVDGITGGKTDWTVMGNQDYFYRITAADTKGNVSKPSNVVHARAVEQLPPVAPTNLRADWLLDSATNHYKVVLSWASPRPDLRMQLQRMDAGNILWKTVWPGIAGAWSAVGASSAADPTAAHARKGNYRYRLVIKTASGYTNFSNIVKA